jgi:crotonobetainyl-CoA:carnitine CoA-transferase CaiB-like acyl-CoA transferase
MFAFQGLRVIELGWALSEPYCCSLLADMGAEVIKVETRRIIDGARTLGPWKDNVPTPPEGSGNFEHRNRNKKSFLLNLRTPQGIEILKRLVKVSDVITENWTAGTMERLGIGYQVLKETNDKIILLRLPAFGQTGPLRNHISFGPIVEALGGFASLIGYSEDELVAPSVAIYDFTGGLFACYLVLAALEYRSKTGKGQCIDMSQYEVGVSVAGHLILDYIMNNRLPKPIGNRHPYACPHGCYRCKGEDKWCVITIFEEAEWVSLCNLIGDQKLTESPKYTTFADRKRNEDELDKLIEKWTVNFEAEDVMHLCQQAGIAAGVVQNLDDQINRDPHMKERQFYHKMVAPLWGEFLYEGIPYKFSVTPGSIRTPAPFIGEHNDYVLREILKMSVKEIEEYDRTGAFT